MAPTLASRRTSTLVLSCREGKSSVIDGEVVVTILEITGNQIRLGINASKDVLVLRAELEEAALVVA